MSKLLARPLAAPIDHLGAVPGAGAACATPVRSGRLLGLVRKLIGHGDDLIATLREQPPPDLLYRIGTGFRCCDVEVILARAMRGLSVATALEDRIVNCGAFLRAPTAPRPEAPVRASICALSAEARARRALLGVTDPAACAAAMPAEDVAALADRRPTSEEIAARIRGRPIGLVLVEICRDLGVDSHHPLWWELLDAIDRGGGNYVPFTQYASKRPAAGFNPFGGRRGPPELTECEPHLAPSVAADGSDGAAPADAGIERCQGMEGAQPEGAGISPEPRVC